MPRRNDFFEEFIRSASELFDDRDSRRARRQQSVFVSAMRALIRFVEVTLRFFMRSLARLARYTFVRFADLFLLNVYLSRYSVRVADLKECRACGAPLVLSQTIAAKEREEGKRRGKLTQCVFCSAQIGWDHRPFELKLLRQARWRRAVYASFVVLAVIVAGAIFSSSQAERCRNMPVAERIVSGCIQPSALTASNADLKVLEAQALPEQDRLVQAIFLANVGRLQFKRGDQFLFDTEPSATPLHLSADGKWLLLRDGDQLKIRPVAERQATPVEFDLQACQLDASASSVNFSWSPDGQRMIISAISDGVRRIKLATLNAARLERCEDVFSQNVRTAAWLGDDHLLYLIEEGDRKRLELRAVSSAQLVFSSELKLVVSTLDNLQVSPSGQHVLFTGEDLSGQKQLYWLNFSEQPALHVLQPAEQHIYPSKFFGWASEYQVAYLNDEGRLVLLNLQAQTVSFTAMSPSVVWIAWQGAN
jgi:hypothetical protein